MPNTFNRIALWREKFPFSFLLVLLLVFLSVLAVNLTRSFSAYEQQKSEVSTAEKQLDQLTQMEAALGAAEGLFRSFVISGDTSLVGKLQEQHRYFFELNDQLKQEPKALASIQTYLEEIEALGKKKFTIQNQLIAETWGKQVVQGPDGARIRYLFAPGSPLMKGSEDIRLRLEQSHSLENMRLQQLHQKLESSYRLIILQFILAGLFLLGLLAFALVQSYRNMARRSKASGLTQTVLDSTTDGFYLLDLDLRIKIMNSPAKTYLDASLGCDAQIGDQILQLLPEHYRQQAKEMYAEAMNGKPVVWQQQLELNGSERVIELHHRAVKEVSSGKVTALSILLQDITEKHKSEVARKKSESTRRLIMNAVQDAVICIDKRGRISYWNEKAHCIFGWSEAEALGKSLNETVIPHYHRNAHTEGFNRYQQSGEHRIMNKLLQLNAVNKEGREIPIEMYILDLKDDNEEFICAFIRDISERKTAEDERNKLLGRLRLTNSMVQLGTWQINLANNELTCDEVVYDVLEQPLSYKLTRDNWLELVHPEDRERITRAFETFVKEGPEAEMYFRIYTPQGKLKYLYQKAVKFKNAEGKTIEAIGGLIDITDLKKAEATFRQVVNASPNALLLVNSKGEIVLTNQQAEKLFGYTEAELTRSTIETLLPDRFRDGHFAIRDGFMAALPSPTVGNGGELFARTKQGLELPIEIGLSPMELEGERMVLASVLDISQRKAAESERQELLTRFELAANTTQMGIWEFDLATGELVWNDNMYDLVAVTRGIPMSFDHWRSLVHPEDLTLLLQHFTESVDSRKDHFEMEYRVVMPDGKSKTLHQKTVTFKNEEGAVVRCLGTSLDVTEQRQAEAVREELLTRFELAAETLHLGILDADLRTGEVQGDAQLKLMLGIEAIARPDWRVWIRQVHPKDRQHMQDLLMKALPQGQLLQAEWRQLRDNGELRYYETKARIIWKQGQPARIIAATIDVTNKVNQRNELIAAKTRAEKSEQLQEQFLANMSHEIRTPLNGIVGMADLMSSTLLTSDQREYLQVIQTSSHGLLTIINDVLDFSKIKAGKFNIEHAPFNLHHVMHSAFELLQLKATQKHLRYQLEIGADVPPTVRGDAGRLSQVLINLLGNAVKFTRQGSVVLSVTTVSKQDNKVQLCFAVADTGIGISKEAQEDIFNSFAQGSREVGVEFGGTGLGLAISRQLIEMQGGTIEVESILGEGATFRVLLQYEVVDGQIEKSTDRNDTMLINRHAGKRVLVAEDNEVNRMVISEYLLKMGLVATLAHDGQQAIDALVSQPPFDLVILDLRMPVMDGFETARLIREELQLQVPIMALTASALRSEKDRCLAIGMNTYMAKPFKAAELYNNILRLLDGIHLNEQPVVTPTASTEPSLYDLSELEQLGEPEFALQIIDTFNTNGQTTLQEIEAAYGDGNLAMVFELAHRMKSSSGMLGAAPLMELFRQLESEARMDEPDADLVGSLIAATKQCFQITAQALEQAKSQVANWQ